MCLEVGLRVLGVSWVVSGAPKMLYLAVQAYSVPSERVFSVASRVISKYRGNMDPNVAGQLDFLYDNWEDWEDNVEVLKLVAGPHWDSQRRDRHYRD